MIGSTLQKLLVEKGINANELSNIIGVSNQTLYSIIKRDNMKIDFDVLLKICVALNVSVERFYNDYNVKNDTNTVENISTIEHECIKKYRILDEKGKHTVDTVLKMEYDRCATDNDIRTYKIAARNGKDTITLTKEQREELIRISKEPSDIPDGTF